MFSPIVLATLIPSLLLAYTAHGFPVVPGESLAKRDATFAGSLSQCPAVSPRSTPPTSVHDL